MDEIAPCCRCGRAANPSYRGAVPGALLCRSCRPGALEQQRNQLLEAIEFHAREVEREVSKNHWSRANGELYDARFEILRQLERD